MSLENPDINFKLKMLIASKTKEDLMKIIHNYNDYCKQNDLPERVLKGYSKKPYNTKEGLIDFLIERLADEEKQGIMEKIEEPYLQDLFKVAQEYIGNQIEREKIETVKLMENSIHIDFKGWQWESKIDVELASDGAITYYNCTCKTGKIEGFCPHLAIAILILIKEKKINLDKFLFKIPRDSLKQIQEMKAEIKKLADVDIETADIILGDDYLISINGNIVKMKWGGDMQGS